MKKGELEIKREQMKSKVSEAEKMLEAKKAEKLEKLSKIKEL